MTLVFGTRTFGLLAVAAIGLAACGGSTSTSQAEFIERLDRFDHQSVRVLGDGGDENKCPDDFLCNTIPDGIPDEGTAKFTGSGTVAAFTGTVGVPSVVAMFGYAEVDVDFAKGTLDGSVINFQTLTISGTDIDRIIEVEDGAELKYGASLEFLRALRPLDTTGNITLSGGSIAGNAIDGVTYGGTLRAGGTTYLVAGTAGGNFLGTRPAVAADPDLFRVKALNIYDEDGTVTAVGKDVESSFEIIAESN